MKTEDKAYQLYEKYFCITPEYLTNEECVLFAKQCASIAVDEIISTIKIDYMRVQSVMQTLSYWKDVKQEIEKL